MPVPAPQPIVEAFALNGLKRTIPVPTQLPGNPGNASFNDGFPAATFQPLTSGGQPMSGYDMNGILNMLSQYCANLQAGQGITYNAAVAAAIGGYAVGALLWNASGTGYWFNIVAGNTSDPDTGGAGWLGFSAGAVNVLTYGADATGTEDSTTAFQAAISTGYPVYVPAGTFNVGTATITMTTPYQRIYGDGLLSQIHVPNTANLTVPGYFDYTAAGQDDGPWFENLRFTADQSVVASSGVRANLTQYAACLFMRNAPRFRVINCRIEAFLIGIDAQGLDAGFTLESVDMCVYQLGLAINGSGDTIRLKDYHCIPLNSWTSNQLAIWGDGSNTHIYTGRNDGMDISDSLFLGGSTANNSGTAINSFTGTGVNIPGTYPGSGFLTGNTKAQIVNSGFDTACSIIQSAVGSWINIVNSYFSNGNNTTIYALHQTAGTVTITGGNCQSNVVPNGPLFYVNNNSGSLVNLNIADFTFNGPPGMTQFVEATGATLSLISVNDCTVLVSPGAAGPLFQTVGANVRMTFTGNQFGATAQTANLALVLDTDNAHVVTDNAFNGWNIACPGSAAIASASQSVANPGVFATATQGWSAGQPVYITGTAPGGFSNGVIYYVIAGGLTANSVELAATIGGAGIQCTASAACNLVPINATGYTQAIIANNSIRGTLNFNAANVCPLSGNTGAATVAANTTVYLGPGALNTAAGRGAFQCPKAGNCVGFQVVASTGPGASQTFTYTVYHNGVATQMTGSTTGASGNTAVSVNQFPIAANDTIELQLVTSASANAGYHQFSLLFEPA